MIQTIEHPVRILATALIAVLPAAAVPDADISAMQAIAWAAVISTVSGAASSLRSGRFDRFDCLTVALNTGVLGACIAMIGLLWSRDQPHLHWPIVGAVGIISLGGLASVDWVQTQARRIATKRIENDETKPPRQPPIL